MKILIDALRRDLSDKKILLKVTTPLFGKAVAAKIHKEIGCEVRVANDLDTLKKTLAAGCESFFVGVFDYSPDDSSDMDAIEFALSKKLPVIALTHDLNDDIRDTLLSKNIVDYVLKRSIDDIDYVVRLIRQLAINSTTEVLVVDDSSVYRKNLSNILNTQGFIVYEAKDGEEAIRLIEEHKGIKLVLTDYFMPKMDGFELVMRLRKIKSKDELAIIAVSSDAHEMAVSKFLKYGANDYVKKPFSKEEFICRINNNVEHISLVEFQKELVNLDFLTGLHNRRYLMDTGRMLHANAVRGNIDFTVGMIDLDDFKSINDRYGHDVGDMVIKDFAERLKGSFRKSDIICRFGGEEFCVILTNIKFNQAEGAFEKLLQSVRDAKITTKQQEVVQYTVSIGVCATLLNRFEDMLKLADERLYMAKKIGKDVVVTNILPS